MNSKSVAPCGLICDLCICFQREKNRCTGCNKDGFKPRGCIMCKIKLCPEKNGNENEPCSNCSKFPCQRIKNLNKRYRTKYGENNIDNLLRIRESGMETFIIEEDKKWRCKQCGALLCAHKSTCLKCGERNMLFPEPKE